MQKNRSGGNSEFGDRILFVKKQIRHFPSIIWKILLTFPATNATFSPKKKYNLFITFFFRILRRSFLKTAQRGKNHSLPGLILIFLKNFCHQIILNLLF